MMSGSPSTDRGPAAHAGWRILDPRRSLRAWTAVVAGGAVVLLTLPAYWLTGSALRRQIESQLGANFAAIAYQAADKLDRTLYERYRGLQFAAGLPILHSPAASADERRRLLESIQEASPDFAWIGFANSAGTVVAATGRELEGSGADVRNWFRNARTKPYAGDVRDAPEMPRGVDESGGPPRFLDLSVPVTADNGQFLGVLGAEVAWSALAPDAVVSVMPTAAQHDRIDLTIYSARSEVLLDSGGSGWSEPFDSPVLPDPRKPRGSFMEDTPNGVSFLTGYARSRGRGEFRGFGWLVAVRQPVANAFAAVTALQHRVLQVGLGLAALVALIGWFLASRLTRRVRSIGASARRIREGDSLAVLPQPHDRGEISTMCAELGDMVDAFRRQQEKLEIANTRLAARMPDLEKDKSS